MATPAPDNGGNNPAPPGNNDNNQANSPSNDSLYWDTPPNSLRAPPNSPCANTPRRNTPAPNTPAHNTPAPSIHAPSMRHTTPRAITPPPIRPSVDRIVIPGGSAGTKIEVMLDTKAGNWPCWSRLMNYLFAAVEVKHIVYRQIMCPDPVRDPDGTRNWIYNDNYAQMLITTNISENLMVHTEGCPTANNMWQTLRAMFEATANLEYTEHLRPVFENRASEGTNILDHLTKLKSTWHKIHIHSNP